MRKPALQLGIVVVALLVITVGAIVLFRPTPASQTDVQLSEAPFHGATFEPVETAPDFQLTTHRGAPFTLSDQKGKVVVLFFGFTSCPDVCPTTLAHFKHVKQRLGDAADDVRFVMVTVDPERDDQERMRQYVEAFDPEFIGLTGTLAELQAAWDAYHVRPQKIEVPGSALGYSVSHPASSYVIDPEGNLRLLHFYGLPADLVAEDLERLLT